MSRRTLLQLAAGGVLGAFGLVACSESSQVPDVCPGSESLPPASARLRESLEYVERATVPERACDLCQQYTAAESSGSCGSCKLVPGPIHPKGSCKVFTAKVG
jgi:hypothetical protein